MRLYLESFPTPHRFAAGERVTVPASIFRTALEAPFPPRSWLERAYDVRSWTELPRGGHFAALEVPQELAGDVRAFFREIDCMQIRAGAALVVVAAPHLLFL